MALSLAGLKEIEGPAEVCSIYGTVSFRYGVDGLAVIREYTSTPTNRKSFLRKDLQARCRCLDGFVHS